MHSCGHAWLLSYVMLERVTPESKVDVCVTTRRLPFPTRGPRPSPKLVVCQQLGPVDHLQIARLVVLPYGLCVVMSNGPPTLHNGRNQRALGYAISKVGDTQGTW